MNANGGSPGIESGLNTTVEDQGRHFHVQTQCSVRDAPVIESMIFENGQVLVRMTASYAEVAGRFGFSADDARHLLEVQHSDLIGKIRHGMLRDDCGAEESVATSHESAGAVDATRERDATTGTRPPSGDSEGDAFDPSQLDDPAALELLRELGVSLDELRNVAPGSSPGSDPAPAPERAPVPKPAAAPKPAATAPASAPATATASATADATANAPTQTPASTSANRGGDARGPAAGAPDRSPRHAGPWWRRLARRLGLRRRWR